MHAFIFWFEHHMLTCPSKALTGVDCPGCGMQRSFIELLKGNFFNSLHLYPALLPTIFTFGITILHLNLKFKNGAQYIMYSFIITMLIVVISYLIKNVGMKIFFTDQIKEADKYTVEHEPISSIGLMERAAAACVKWIVERYTCEITFNIICGLGNNGGDGLSIARLLTERNYKTNVLIINYSEKRSADFVFNYDKLKSISENKNNIHQINTIESLRTTFSLSDESVIIDALFGSGLNKPVEGFAADVIEFVTQCTNKIISIDVPSGLYCDVLNKINDKIISANYTLTFQFPKLSFMFPETSNYVGEFDILDINLHPTYIRSTASQNYFLTKNDITTLLKKRNKTAHKGNFGHALIVAGSYGKMGAAVLSTRACLRSGVGLVTVHIPKAGNEIVQIAVPEAMADVDSEQNFISDSINLDRYNAIGVGPGIGIEKQTQNVVKLLIQNSIAPLVFDADAINCISENKTWLAFVPAGSIFTPHLKEFERMTGKSANSLERLHAQREFSIKNAVYVVLKGAHTSISCPDGNVFFNSTGNPGMATGGSGDVLTGIITSLLAQGYTSYQACVLAVYIHGSAGDFASYNKSEESMIASDIIEYLPQAFNFLRS